MADISKGFTFAANEFSRASMYHGLVDNASLSAIVRTDSDDSVVSFVHKASTAPGTPKANEFWYDTSVDDLKRFNNTLGDFQSSARSIIMLSNTETNASIGDVVAANNKSGDDLLFNFPGGGGTSPDERVVGVLLENVTDGNSGAVAIQGITDVHVGATITRGQFVEGEESGTFNPGARVVSTKSIDSFGIAVAEGNPDTLVKCVLFR